MQKGVFLLANIDKGGFQSGFEVLNLAFEYCPDHAVFVEPLDLKTLKNSILHHGNPPLKGFRIDDQFLIVLVRFTTKERDNSLPDGSILSPFESFFPKVPLVNVNRFGLNRRQRQVCGC